LVYRYIAARESAVYMNHKSTLYITELSPINHFFHNCCLSWLYLGKYKRDWNWTWYIHRC